MEAPVERMDQQSDGRDDRIKALFVEEDDHLFLREMYPHGMEVFGKAGWDDPAMDVYNDLDPRRQ